MFGSKAKCEGWSLYLCQNKIIYNNIFNFYTKLQKYLINNQINYSIRNVKYMGLVYKGFYAMFI